MVVGIALYISGYFKPKGAGLYIETVPNAAVFINNEEVGRTPFKETRKAEELTVKLIPESFENHWPRMKRKLLWCRVWNLL